MNKLFVLLLSLSCALPLFAQKIDIIITDTAPYYVDQEIHVEIYLNNNTDTTLTFFDSRGPIWDSFKEFWELRVISKSQEVLPLNNNHNHKFSDSTFITLEPNDTCLIREHKIKLLEAGLHSLTYTQEQSAALIEKKYADNTVSDSLINKVNTFTVSENIKFEVVMNYDTSIHEIINMSWDEWKDYRRAKLYSRHNNFDNMYAAERYAQDVYALTLFCDGLSANELKRIGRLKNLRALTLRNYDTDVFPKELADLNLYELTVIPKNENVINYPAGLSTNNTIRELEIKSYNGFPEDILNQKYLIELKINDCPLNILPPLDSLQNLEILIANNTGLNTLSNIGFDKLLSLKELNLSGNKAIDNLNPLLNCKSLEFLTINRTNITCIPDEIEQLNKLKKLSISNKLTAISDSIYKLSDMRYLSFGGNRKLTQIPKTIVKMEKLLHIDVSSTKISQLPEGFSNLPLEKVMIYNTECKITKDYKILKKKLGPMFKE